MSNSKNILGAIAEFDQDFADAIGEVKLNFLFEKKAAKGMTFFLPNKKTNAILYNKIMTLANAESEEEMVKGSDLIVGLLFFEYLPHAEAIASSKTLKNRVGGRICADVQKKGETIAFANGATAKLLDNSEPKKYIIYDLIRGTPYLPAEKKEETTVGAEKEIENKRAPTNRSRRKVAHPTQEEIEKEQEAESKRAEEINAAFTNRRKITLATESAAIQHYTVARRRLNPFIDNAMSLMHFIIEYCGKDDIANFVENALPHISFDNSDFYILFEPYKVAGDFLIPHHIINRWAAAKLEYSPKQTYAAIDKLMIAAEKTRPKIFADRYKIHEILDTLTLELIGKSDDKGKIAQEIFAVYSQLAENNQIGGLGPILPDALAAAYKKDPMRKLLIDEFRFLMYKQFSDLESEYFDHIKFREITEMAREFLISPAPTSQSSLRLLNPALLRFAPERRLSTIRIFLNSSFFMYFPTSKAAMDRIKEDFNYSEEIPAPNQIDVDFWIPPQLSGEKFNKLPKKRGEMSEEEKQKYAANRAMKHLSKLKNVDILGEDAKKKLAEFVQK